MRARVLALVAVLVTVFAIYGYQRSTAAVGRPAPGFTLMDGSGRSVSLQALRGRVVLLEFWASWCTVCRLDTPAVRTFAERYSGQVSVVGVDWREPPSALQQWVSVFGLRFPNVRDAAGTVGRKYGLSGVPEAWWIAPDGTARLHVIGPVDFETLQRQYNEVTGTALDAAVGPEPAALAVSGGRLWLAAADPAGGVWTRAASDGGAWTRADVPGPFQAVAAEGGTVMAAGTSAGLVASTDGGIHWTRVGVPAGSVPSALAADPGDPGAFYAWAGGRLLRASSARSGFVPLPAQPPLPAGATVSALAARGAEVIVATVRGIFVSPDGGAHWRASDLRRPPLGTQEFTTATAAIEDSVPLLATGAVIGPRGTAYLAGPDGVYAADRGGTGSAQRLPSAPARVIAAVAGQEDGTLWAVAPDGDLYAGAPTGPWRQAGIFAGQAVRR